VVNNDREWDFLYWDETDYEDDLLEDGVDDIFIKKEKDKPYIDDDYDY